MLRVGNCARAWRAVKSPHWFSFRVIAKAHRFHIWFSYKIPLTPKPPFLLGCRSGTWNWGPSFWCLVPKAAFRIWSKTRAASSTRIWPVFPRYIIFHLALLVASKGETPSKRRARPSFAVFLLELPLCLSHCGSSFSTMMTKKMAMTAVTAMAACQI